MSWMSAVHRNSTATTHQKQQNHHEKKIDPVVMVHQNVLWANRAGDRRKRMSVATLLSAARGPIVAVNQRSGVTLSVSICGQAWKFQCRSEGRACQAQLESRTPMTPEMGDRPVYHPFTRTSNSFGLSTEMEDKILQKTELWHRQNQS
jgi:hypothetical protein